MMSYVLQSQAILENSDFVHVQAQSNFPETLDHHPDEIEWSFEQHLAELQPWQFGRPF